MFGLAFAMGGAPGGAGGAGGGMAAFQQIIPLVFMFAIFYFHLLMFAKIVAFATFEHACLSFRFIYMQIED